MARILTRFGPHRGGKAQGEFQARSGRSMLVPLAMAQFLSSYDCSSMNVAISRITEDLRTTVTGVQAVITLFTLTMAALMIPGSKLSDIWGRKRCFMVGIGIYGVGALVTSLAPNVTTMALGWSILEGIGSALMIPPIYILITVSCADTVSRTKAFALVSAAAGLGSASGPLVGGFITTTITWRASFFAEALTTLVILYSSRRILDTRKKTGQLSEFDFLGAVLSAIGLVFIVLGVLQAGNFGWLHARQDFVLGGRVILQRGEISPVVVFMAIGMALLAVFVVHVKHQERLGRVPLISTRLFKNKTVNLGLVTQNVQWFMMLGTFFVISVFLQVSRGYDAIRTGVLVTPATLGILVSSTRMGKMTQKFSQRSIIRAGFVIALLGTILLILLVKSSSSVLLFVPGLFLLGFGAGIMLTASVNVVQSSVPDEDQGELSGVSRSVSNLGSSLGVAIAGAVLISALNIGLASGVAQSTVLLPDEKHQLDVALEQSVSAVSDARVREVLRGKPPTVVEEVTRINAMARDRAITLALGAVGLFGLLGLLAALLLPQSASQPRPEKPLAP